jgi:hypothetical protein
MDEQPVRAGAQVRRHRSTHDAEADESNLAHAFSRLHR